LGVAVLVNVDDLHRIADRAILAEPLAVFEHLVHVKHARAPVDQIFVDLPGEPVAVENHVSLDHAAFVSLRPWKTGPEAG